MPRKAKSEPIVANTEDVALLGIDYFNKKDSIKALETQCKEIRKPLESYIESNGRTLDSGSKLAVVAHADVEVHLKKTLRVGKVLLPEAIDVLRKNHLDVCIENIPTIREDILEAMYEKGEVTDEILKQIYTDKSTYAFSVDVKERFKE